MLVLSAVLDIGKNLQYDQSTQFSK